jgi:hypothetical protein
MENTIEQIKSLVNTLNLQNTPLLEKPLEYELKYLSTDISKGKFIKSRFPEYSDPTYWRYPNGVEEKIEDDKTYKVWFDYRDAADPYDSTTWYLVKYIEEVPDDKIALIKYLEKLLKELK